MTATGVPNRNDSDVPVVTSVTEQSLILQRVPQVKLRVRTTSRAGATLRTQTTRVQLQDDLIAAMIPRIRREELTTVPCRPFYRERQACRKFQQASARTHRDARTHSRRRAKNNHTRHEHMHTHTPARNTRHPTHTRDTHTHTHRDARTAPNQHTHTRTLCHSP